ncbi:uncharacterized protein LOC111806476 [Cucurbita pepo subsp. pepo]|uniref:uncharacterized protein LOC111806474 n=1 Tax=Cucurbita pepo subsp. pepo TaxID=3664 RepID=UPI000C9D40D4|nr:uncharacterized protein LOC111806474 [Cucurbita pepo subsp. pepo]XP_023547580.1 uncharacterized protein LOC111806476 [Cucurbita pepo subsp. pepo]
MLSSPENQVDVGTIDFATFVSIDSQQFKYMVNMFTNSEKVDVTMRPLQVMFQSPESIMILNKEDKQCIIGGIEDGEELGFSITLSPTTFFNDLTLIVDRVWLHLTTTGVSVICAPIDLNVQIEIYFKPSLEVV